MQHDYHIETQAKIKALEALVGDQSKQIEALQTEVDRLRECWKVDRAELTRRDNLDALNRRIDSYFE